MLGGRGPFHVQLRRKVGSETLAKVGLPNIISANKPTKFILEVTDEGKITLYSSHNPFVPIFKVFDKQPLQVKYLSFSSNEDKLAQFFFGCENDDKEIDDSILSTRFNEDEDSPTLESVQKLVLNHKYGNYFIFS